MITDRLLVSWEGEGRAVYENVFDYLLARYQASPVKIEIAMESPWGKAILLDALRQDGAAFWAGDRIARRVGWRYRKDRE